MIIPLPNVATADTSHPLRTLVSDEGIFYVSSSSQGTFAECARKGEYLLVQRRLPVRVATALDAGKSIHKYIESRMLGGSVLEANKALVDSFPIVPDGEWRTLNHAATLLAKYEAEYPKESYTLLSVGEKPSVEQTFAIDLGDIHYNGVVKDPRTGTEKHYNTIRVVYNGVIDALVEDYGEVFAFDHKTTSRLGGDYFDQFRNAAQTVGYVYAAKAILERDVAGAWINALVWRKPSAKGTPFEFSRKKLRYTNEQLEEWKHNTLVLAGDFLSHLQRSYFPMETQWCMSKWGRCPYFDVCALSPSERPTLINSALFQDNLARLDHSPNEEET